jgi:hypothetical protein
MVFPQTKTYIVAKQKYKCLQAFSQFLLSTSTTKLLHRDQLKCHPLKHSIHLQSESDKMHISSFKATGERRSEGAVIQRKNCFKTVFLRREQTKPNLTLFPLPFFCLEVQ